VGRMTWNVLARFLAEAPFAAPAADPASTSPASTDRVSTDRASQPAGP
jgi:hypothetical protein